MDTTRWKELERKAHELRLLTLDTVKWAGSGHVGGALSSIDLLTVLYHDVMNYSADQIDDPLRDRFVLSKGHIGVGFAPVLADLGCFPIEWLHTYNRTGSPLGIHLNAKDVPGVEASTGSLGHGLPMAVGMAIASRLTGQNWRTYCLLGDGECDEGSVWEAAMAAAHYQTDNLVAFVDRNRAMIDGLTEDVMRLEPFVDKWKAFGWETFEIDGHHLPTIRDTIDAAHAVTGKPVMIVANTIKGEGIDTIAGDYRWHYGAFDGDRYDEARQSLEHYYQARLAAVEGR